MSSERKKKKTTAKKKTPAKKKAKATKPKAKSATKSKSKAKAQAKKKTRSQKAQPERKTRAADAPAAHERTVPLELPDTLLGEMDLHLFNEGTHLGLHDKLGAHPMRHEGKDYTYFAVWAPGVQQVTVMGDFNGWDKSSHPLWPRGHSGIWEARIEGVAPGTAYKYHIVSGNGQYRVDKADPVGFRHEIPPLTASVVSSLDYEWNDADWMANRGPAQTLEAPISIYEMHLGSWRRSPETPSGWLGYRDLAPLLADYVSEMGFTHVEFLPVMEHPFYGSWGYQTTGYFAPTSRYGSPQDFMYLIDHLHQHGIGVILDWVPSHFPNDEHGLGYFTGEHLYEHEDPRQGFHPDWNSLIFNYTRHEVRSFLLSSALFWLDKYHVDALRIDAVASMLYLDYSRKENEWIPNEFGGRENLSAIDFLRHLNLEVFGRHPDAQTFAEESTSWPMVSRPTYVGGLGFGFKWDMGWMHDTLEYFKRDPIYRPYHQNELTFRQIYAFSENFALPLSHDEVVHGKSSLLGRMPGDAWQQFANLRVLFSYMYAQNGKKLLFMGGEFGQWSEWNHDTSLDWHLLSQESHEGIQRVVRDLNRLYRSEPALHEYDCDVQGFEWLDASDAAQCVMSFIRKGRDPEEVVIAAFNFTPVPRHNYRIGTPRGGKWQEIFNSDATHYGGSGQGNLGGVEAVPAPCHGRKYSMCVTLPPLAAVFFKKSVDGQ